MSRAPSASRWRITHAASAANASSDMPGRRNRVTLGRAILHGLELLEAADFVGTAAALAARTRLPLRSRTARAGVVRREAAW